MPERAPDAGKTISTRQFLVPSAQDCNLAAAWLKIDVDALRPSWKQFDLEVDLLQSHLITLEDEARWAMARGHVAKGLVSNFLPHLYLDALLAVEPERVTVFH